MFCAVQDDELVWRLGIRRIRRITGYFDYTGKRQDIRFTSRAKAKECADYLNTWHRYDDFFDKHTGNMLPNVDKESAYGEQHLILEVIRSYSVKPS